MISCRFWPRRVHAGLPGTQNVRMHRSKLTILYGATITLMAID
jgi:hypothetical protein